MVCKRLTCFGLAVALSFAALVGAEDATLGVGEVTVDFTVDVRPILSDKCFFCHGPDAAERQADLRLDVADTDDSGIGAGYIVPGDRDSSSVWQRIIDKDDPMPPVDSHKTLSAEEIEMIGRWIDQGALYDDHWAYTSISKSAPPADGGSGASDIDRFIRSKLQARGLQPSPAATPERLIRRLALDLTGLPPTEEQVAAYASDPSDATYNKLVDELIASPRFGEHWAAWWLDLVRYGDSVGFHGDQAYSVWPYRDWLINAFNDNIPFVEFSRLQLAGDLMESEDEKPSQREDRLAASIYNRLIQSTAEGGAQQAEYLTIYAADRVSNFGEVWLASSTRCAQCHDHKYDPYTSADFYSLSAVFADIDQPIIANNGANPHWAPFRFLPENDEQAAQIEETDSRYYAILAEFPEAGPYESWLFSRDAGPAPPHGPWAEEFKQITKRRVELGKTIPHAIVTRPLPKPRTVRFLPRGNWLDESGEIMAPRPPAFLGGAASDDPFDRLALADWLFETDNPLTARVVVNRLWSRFLGRGLSSNTLDFGNQGAPPTHRELLDWLASTFVESGWDMQHVMRLIVMSDTYKQSSDDTAELVSADPENLWFARQTPTRLPAEVIRDQALAASGLLVNRLGGPSVFPYQPRGHWAPLNFPTRRYSQSSGLDLYRRSVYTWVQRTFPHPAMTVFDAPNRESCTAQRPESNTPLQALALLNETLSVETARALAETAMLATPDLVDRVPFMFRRVLFRDPTDRELARLIRLYDAQSEYFANDPVRAKALCTVGDSTADVSLSEVELAAYTSVSRVLLNLHETVTKP